ncbi:ribosomal protein L21 [Eubacterium nodatum ATCC 33099]|nr:ribosomal protein L21 [Eubacterium nodatum ATCC 33099]
MYAVIETGGKQYRVQEGDILNIEKLGIEEGESVEFEKVLVLNNDSETKFGTPYVKGAKVVAEVKKNGKGPKIIIFKYKNKKDYRKKQGHRQPFTTVEITSLTGEVKKVATPVKEEAKPVKISSSMKKDELIAYAKEHNIEIDEKATKAVIIEAIENAEK